jgi:hypothetical protein
MGVEIRSESLPGKGSVRASAVLVAIVTSVTTKPVVNRQDVMYIDHRSLSICGFSSQEDEG